MDQTVIPPVHSARNASKENICHTRSSNPPDPQLEMNITDQQIGSGTGHRQQKPVQRGYSPMPLPTQCTSFRRWRKTMHQGICTSIRYHLSPIRPTQRLQKNQRFPQFDGDKTPNRLTASSAERGKDDDGRGGLSCGRPSGSRAPSVTLAPRSAFCSGFRARRRGFPDT